MSNRKVTDLVAVEHYYSNDVDDEYSYGGTAPVPALENPKVTDLVAVENYSNVDDEYSNSYGGTVHDVAVPESHPLDHEDPSHVPNCVLKLRKRPEKSAASIKEFLHKRLRRKKICMISIDVETNTVAICGYVNPATIIWTVSDCAGVEATLVFFKEFPRPFQGEVHPLYCENIVFRVYGEYCKFVREELQKIKGINSVIVESNYPDSDLWMSISGDCFNAGVVRKRLMKLCHCDHKEDMKVLSKKIAKHTTFDLKASNDMTPVEITVDFIVPRNHGRECATEINEMLLSTNGVSFVLTHFRRSSRLASVNVRGDDRLDLDTIVKTVLDAGGIKPRLRKSLISQLIFALCG